MAPTTSTDPRGWWSLPTGISGCRMGIGAAITALSSSRATAPFSWKWAAVSAPRAKSPLASAIRTTSRWIPGVGSSSRIAAIAGSRFSTGRARSSTCWTHYGKPSGLFIDRNDILYAGDGLSGSLRTGPPDPWRSNLGWEKGIRIGDLKTEQAWVTHFIPHHEEDVGAGIEFLGVDFDGNIYAGEVSRQRLVRYVPFRPPEVWGNTSGGRGAR